MSYSKTLWSAALTIVASAALGGCLLPSPLTVNATPTEQAVVIGFPIQAVKVSASARFVDSWTLAVFRSETCGENPISDTLGLALTKDDATNATISGSLSRIGVYCLRVTASRTIGSETKGEDTEIRIKVHPALTALNPASRAARSGDFTLRVFGDGFESPILVTGHSSSPSSSATRVISPTELEVDVSGFDILMQGTRRIGADVRFTNTLIEALVVTNGMPTSETTLPFTIMPPGPPGITTASPLPDATVDAAYSETIQATGGTTPYSWTEVIPAGGMSGLPPGLMLTQAPGSNDASLSGTPTQAGAFSFTAQVTDSANPAASDSRQFSVQVNNPAPVITLLAPDQAREGDPALTLFVEGSGFVSTSEVRWNGAMRATTFVSATRLTADIQASDLAARGTAQVEVFTPAPGGGVSNALTFTINVPPVVPPTITSIVPNSAPANSSGFPMQVNGMNFDSTSVVMWDGVPLVTDTSGAPSLLIATVPDANLAVSNPPVMLLVRVVNSPPGITLISNDVDFTITAPPGPTQRGVLEQISVDSAGTPGNSESGTDGIPRTISMSGDGRYVVFQSFADNLSAGDTNGLSDVFLRDTCRGPSAPLGCQKSTTRLSNPIVSERATGSPGISGDGQWIAFVARDHGPALHLVVHPRAGGTPVTLATAGSALAQSSLYSPVLSRDGRHVAFVSNEPLMLPNLFGVDNAFVLDRDADGNGVFDEPNVPGLPATTRLSQVSVTLSGQFFAESSEVAISASGRFVAFSSREFDLVPADNNNSADIFLHDRDADGNGVFDEPGTTTIVRVSVDSNGMEASKAGAVTHQRKPEISGDGRFVAFASDADNLLGPGVDTNDADDIFVHDTCFGAPAGCTPSTSRVSLSDTGAEVKNFFITDAPAISATGRFVAFKSSANDLVPPGSDLNPNSDTFVRDTCFGAPAGCLPKTVIVSVPLGGHMVIGGGSRFQTHISEDGSLVLFNSQAQNLTGPIIGFFADLFLAGSGLHESLPAPPPPASQARVLAGKKP